MDKVKGGQINWDKVRAQADIARCLKLGISTSILKLLYKPK